MSLCPCGIVDGPCPTPFGCSASRPGIHDARAAVTEREEADSLSAPTSLPTDSAGRKDVPLAMGLLDDDATRAPLLTLDTAPRERLTTLLRSLGLLGEGGREAAKNFLTEHFDDIGVRSTVDLGAEAKAEWA